VLGALVRRPGHGVADPALGAGVVHPGWPGPRRRGRARRRRRAAGHHRLGDRDPAWRGRGRERREVASGGAAAGRGDLPGGRRLWPRPPPGPGPAGAGLRVSSLSRLGPLGPGPAVAGAGVDGRLARRGRAGLPARPGRPLICPAIPASVTPRLPSGIREPGRRPLQKVSTRTDAAAARSRLTPNRYSYWFGRAS